MQLRRYRTYVEVLGARILANGEDVEMVEAMAMQTQQQQLLPSGKFVTTDLDYDATGGVEGRSSPISDNAVMKADTDSLLSAGSGASTSAKSGNRYSYRAAMYQHPEQDVS